MAVSKVIYGGETLVDLTSDTVTANDLAEGVTATAADGTQITGLLPKVDIDDALSSTSTNPVQNKVITAALASAGGNSTIAYYTGAVVKPQELICGIYSTADLTLDISDVVAKVNNNEALTFTAIISADTSHSLIVKGVDIVTTYSKSKILALSSGGLLLTILIAKDSNGNVTAIANGNSLQQATNNYIIYTDNSQQYFVADEVKALVDDLYYGNIEISEVSMVDVLTIGNGVFGGNIKLKTANFDNCTSVGDYASTYQHVLA